jgi:hypothetical protein
MQRTIVNLSRALTGALVLVAATALADTAPTPTGGTNPAASRPAAKATTTTARGVVKAVNGSRLALDTGQPGAPSALTIQLDDATVVTKLGKSATVKDLHAGDPVTVSYATHDGKPVAKRVWIKAR